MPGHQDTAAQRMSGAGRGVPLERKLPLLVVALFALLFGASLAVAYYEQRHAAIETAGERLASIDRVFGSLIEQQNTGRIGLIRRVARDSAIRNQLRSPNRPLSPNAIRALGALYAQVNDTATPPELWDARGVPLRQPELAPPENAGAVSDELLRSVAAGESAHVTRVRLDGVVASYYAAVPVRSDDGELLGFVGQERRINVNPRALPLMRGFIGPDIDFYFHNADDATWIRFTGAVVPPPTNERPALDSLRIYSRPGVGDVLAATTPIRGTPLLVTVERPMRAILARPLATTRLLALISLVLASVGAFIVWLLSRRIVRPLSELTRAAEAIAAGDYGRRVSVESGDEIGRLGSAFNRMALEVQSSADLSKQALDRLTSSIETQEFLAEASRILAGSVSDDTLLTDLAAYCVPRLADYCSIHVADDAGDIHRIETAHRDPSRLPLVRRLLASYRYEIDGSDIVPRVIRTQTPVLISHVDLESVTRAAPSQEAAQLLAEVRPTSFMTVPLVARGRGFGAITFSIAGSGRVLRQEDLDIAMELARRTAGAIDNAVIYRRSLELRLEAEAASNAKSEFLAKMSHEIRTPINAMMGYAELMQLGISGPVTEAQFKQLGRIRASGDHLTALIGEILDLAKIEAGRMHVEMTAAPISEAIESAVTVVRPLASAKGIELASFADGDGTAPYFGDPQRVQQILTNLLSNAVKFTSPGGRVALRVDTGVRPIPGRGDVSGDWLSVSVSDNGVGVSDVDRERIFHPFVQVDAGYTRSQGGTGLGLTISRNLAHLMGGEITVESAVGAGSTFTLWLPCPVRALALR
jgi:signal transduction histidine kinase